MILDIFTCEQWMTLHEGKATYNLTDTCVSPLSLEKLEQLLGFSIYNEIKSVSIDYGDIVGSNRLKKAILSLYKQGNNDNITLTTGASTGNKLVMETLLEANDHVIVTSPSYQQFYSYAKSLNCMVDIIHLNKEENYIPSVETFINAMKPNTKMICLTSPNNPTGSKYSKQWLIQLIEAIKDKHIYLLIDEIYQGLLEEIESISDIYELGIATSSLSKIYSTAGLRIGWIKAKKEIIDLINYRRDYSFISCGPLQDLLASIVLENKEKILERNKKIVLKNKKIIQEIVSKTNYLSVNMPPEGTVCLLYYDKPILSVDLCEALEKEKSVFFVPGKCFNEEYALRLTFTNDPEKTEKGLKLLIEYLNEKCL